MMQVNVALRKPNPDKPELTIEYSIDNIQSFEDSDTIKFQKTTIFCAKPAAVQRPIRQNLYSIRWARQRFQ